MTIDWQRLWEHVIREFQCDPESIHGPSHWRRVERNGLFLATRTGAVADVVKLFAVFHDSRREDDGSDVAHGRRAVPYAEGLRGKLFEIPNDHFELFRYACSMHTVGHLSDQPTIGTCWDADRLDLGRVGKRPSARYMSTAFAREIANIGPIELTIAKEKEGKSVSSPPADSTHLKPA